MWSTQQTKIVEKHLNLVIVLYQGSPNYGPRGHFVRPASRLPVAKNDQSSARCTRGICPNPPKINQYLINTQLHMCTSDVNRAAYTAACGRARPRSAA